jgi:ATP-binding cassette subfamily B protein
MRERLSAFANLPRFFALIWSVSKAMTLGNAALRVVKAAIPVAMLWVAKLIIDEVIIQSALHEPDTTRLWGLIATELALAIAADITGRAIALLDGLLGDLFSNETSVRLMRHAATLDLSQFENSQFYDKLERARRQTNSRTILLSQVLTQAQEVISIAFLAAGIIAFKPILLLILFVAIIPSFLGETRFSEAGYSLTRQWTPQRRQLDYLRYIGASDETAKEVKVFGLQGFLTERFAHLAKAYYAAHKKLATKRAIWGSALAVVGTTAYYGAYVHIAGDAVRGLITVGQLTFLAGAFLQMRNMLQAIMNRFSQIAENALYLQDLFDFFAIVPQVRNEGPALPIPVPIRQGFTFENVSFQYPGSTRYSVRNLSFHLAAGERLALVGENGAGKTTLVKLLARLYDPTEGRILLDGTDLRAYDLEDLRRHVSVIFQDYVKFQMPVRENIAVGRIEALHADAEIRESARRSLADEVVAKFPNGYEQVLGRRFDEGVELSGGEWQKVALARAYMAQAQLIILDEPTSALDARAEHQVFERFSELMEGRTAVLISHRFSTVRMAHRILFLEQGCLLEIGSHEELMKKGGKYAALFNLQAKGYV